MKIRILLCSLTLALAVAPAIHAQGPKDDETELGGKMDKMNSAFRKLRTDVNDASKNDESIAQVAIIKENATAALELKPAKLADVPEADQAKFVADYQAEMKKLISTLDDLTAALKAGKNDEAKTIFAQIGDIQKEGHMEFRKQKKKKG